MGGIAIQNTSELVQKFSTNSDKFIPKAPTPK